MISPVQPKDIDKKKKKAPAAAAAEGHDEERRREEKGDGERWIWVCRYHRGRPGFDLRTAETKEVYEFMLSIVRMALDD